MAVTGTLYPGTATTGSVAPYDDFDWTTPENVLADDINYATITDNAFDTGQQSYLLYVRNFGSSVPSNGTITGIKVEIGKQYVVGAARDGTLQLINGIGTPLGTSLADLTTNWPSGAPGTVSYGGSGSMWGATLTPDIVNGTSFGLQFAGSAAGNNCDAYVDFIRMMIYYDLPGTTYNVTAAEGNQAQVSDLSTLSYYHSAAENAQAQVTDLASMGVWYPLTAADNAQVQVSDAGSATFSGTTPTYAPTTGTLDAFNRANERPLATATWGGAFQTGYGDWKVAGSVASPAVNENMLRVSAINARYLADSNGNPVYLAGFHTWGNIQDGDESDPPAVFNWNAYLAALISYGCNFTKLWCHEMEQGWSDINNVYFAPTRYERNGPGTAYDNKDKYDVTAINQTYLDRLRARAIDCQDNGIYVCIQLFDGWCVGSKGMGATPFLYHPYEATNNINSLDGDTNDDGEGYEVQYHTGNNALTYEEAMVEAIIDTVNDLDNVIYEICNESSASAENTAWQSYMIDYIRAYELTKPRQHLIGMTYQYPGGVNTDLDTSGADWVSYDTGKADVVHAATDPPSMYDTDHTVGLTNTYVWIWTSFCEGHGGAWYMDEWDGEAYGADTRNNATYILIRNNLGYCLTLTQMLNNLLLMTPQAALSSSGFCLARDHATAAEYICYYSGSSTFTLDLTNATGTLNIRWLRCSDGTVQDSATVEGGAVRTLTPPWTGNVVAYVRHL